MPHFRKIASTLLIVFVWFRYIVLQTFIPDVVNRRIAHLPEVRMQTYVYIHWNGKYHVSECGRSQELNWSHIKLKYT